MRREADLCGGAVMLYNVHLPFVFNLGAAADGCGSTRQDRQTRLLLKGAIRQILQWRIKDSTYIDVSTLLDLFLTCLEMKVSNKQHDASELQGLKSNYASVTVTLFDDEIMYILLPCDSQLKHTVCSS